MSRGIPVLMYHKVGAAVTAPGDTFLNVSTSDFQRQMRLFKRLGYRSVTFAEVVSAIVSRDIPKRAFAITFDDGYQCVYDCAAPVMAEFGFTGTIFAVSQCVGNENGWDRVNAKPVLPLMGWDALAELASRGWEIAGHTRTHPHLDRLTDIDAEYEVWVGANEINAAIGLSPTTFCYPFGDLNARTPAIVKSAGMLGACTTKSGIARTGCDPFFIPRVKVAYGDGLVGLMYRLWLRPLLP